MLEEVGRWFNKQIVNISLVWTTDMNDGWQCWVGRAPLPSILSIDGTLAIVLDFIKHKSVVMLQNAVIKYQKNISDCVD